MNSSYGNPYFPGKRRCILGEGAEEAQERQWSGGGVFSCQCRVSDKGKVTEKTETGPQGRDVFSYEYDAAGHLTMVRKNELISEFYEFDEGGRRVLDFRAWAGGKRRLTYNYDGTLVQAGDAHLKWTEKGQLAAIEEQGRRTAFYYGPDTRLDRALLADGTDIRYHYGNELLPVKITVNGATVAEYQWADKIRLLRYRDARHGLSHDFLYADKRAPVKVLISGSAMDIYQATGFSVQRLELDIRTDQVDSIRALSLPDGRPVKYIEYDSFGNVISDSRPDWKFPLGFACGLNDPWTGLVRFGFRDYNPRFGRFTAKDPARDLRGDRDLWDYCVDDPVGRFDPCGLAWQNGRVNQPDSFFTDKELAEITMGAAHSLMPGVDKVKRVTGMTALQTIRGTGMYADGLNYLFTGTNDRKARDGIDEAFRVIPRQLIKSVPIIRNELKKSGPIIMDGLSGLPGAISRDVKRWWEKDK